MSCRQDTATHTDKRARRHDDTDVDAENNQYNITTSTILSVSDSDSVGALENNNVICHDGNICKRGRQNNRFFLPPTILVVGRLIDWLCMVWQLSGEC